MRIGFLSTRLAGTDGVSLEVEKWAGILEKLGHEIFYCAGELGGYAGGGTLIPLLHFHHPVIAAINKRAFDPVESKDRQILLSDIHAVAQEIVPHLLDFIRLNRLDLLIVQNALAIPMNLPLAVSLKELISKTRIPTIAHNHDFYWERTRFQTSSILDLVDEHFPPDLPSIQHVAINSIAQNRLKSLRGIDSVVVPNVFDFANPPPDIANGAMDLRVALGLKPNDLFILQPTRVIQRKGIELSLELVARLGIPEAHLFITHRADDEGESYWRFLMHQASSMGVRLRLIEDMISTESTDVESGKRFSLWEVYGYANLVTYPSIYEGFGNALLETVYFKRPAVVNRYPVYAADLAPLGFEFVELEGFVDQKAIDDVQNLLSNPDRVRQMTEKNYRIAQEYFSLELLERKIKVLLSDIA